MAAPRIAAITPAVVMLDAVGVGLHALVPVLRGRSRMGISATLHCLRAVVVPAAMKAVANG